MTDNLQDDLSSFASTDEEARRRFEKYKSRDPFPEIAPALLNSADVADYVRVTGMIWPFDPKKRKSASYEIALLGKCVWWDDENKKQVLELTRGTKFELRPNSIAFVTLEPVFRLPDYIALRFNLKISHIYKGILLGTGPLVDPGFEGKKLSLPLHNLTTNNYTFKGGDPIIWMEFTKTSPNARWHDDSVKTSRVGQYEGFPKDKNKLEDVEDYLEKAVGRERLIKSSIPDVIQTAQTSAETAAASATSAANSIESIRTRLRNLGILAAIVALLAIFVPLYLGFYQIHSLVSDSHSYVTEARKELDELNRKNTQRDQPEEELGLELDRLESQIQILRSQTGDQQMKKALEELSLQLRQLKNRRKS